MLENLGCGQYASRPVVCRSLLSKSLDPCIRIFTQNIPDTFLHADNSVDVRTYIVIILQASLTLAGLSHFHYELIQGLAAALAHEDAEARWLAGEPVFANVPVDSGEARQGKLWGLVNKVVSVVRPTI
jgi:hypothetical protein